MIGATQVGSIPLDRLRRLRSRALELGSTVATDLKAFQHKTPKNGFVRLPSSPSDDKDVNVTTTCSCLMALALTDSLGTIYSDGDEELKDVCTSLVEAPWMSSGLAENNAFTTTLVLRTIGLLIGRGRLETAFRSKSKRWEPTTRLRDPVRLARRLKRGDDSLSRVMHSLMGVDAKEVVDQLAKVGKSVRRTQKLEREVSRLVRTSNLFDQENLDEAKLSAHTKAALAKGNRYALQQANRLLLDDYYGSKTIQPMAEDSLLSIAKQLSATPSYFGINEYSPSAAVIYWFVDGVDRGQFRLTDGEWTSLCVWANSEFAQQRSLVVSKHAVMMDPIAMAMAACLCARLRRIIRNKKLKSKLPSDAELEDAILELFKEQTSSGIWPKYFPLFHYQDAGSNFCFTFELLEAILAEFGHDSNQLLGNDLFVTGLERAIDWCEGNRVVHEQRFRGWNSGGSLQSLQKGEPESWATAVVHMFLWELTEALSVRIQGRLLHGYAAEPGGAPCLKKLNGMLDIDLWVDRKQHCTLKSVLKAGILATFKGLEPRQVRGRGNVRKPVSALLFGPPGTSKTQVARAIAAALGWPLVQIDPSHFLKQGLTEIYVEADKVFGDLMDLSCAVVLFDEMDALVQRRDGDKSPLDTAGKFLTTFMLPKLVKLHDQGRIVFLMATNYQEDFDAAIKRPGRFDLLACMGPPTLKAKCNGLHLFYGFDKPSSVSRAVGKTLLSKARQQRDIQNILELYTYGDFGSFVTGMGSDVAVLGAKIKEMSDEEFATCVRNDGLSASLKLSEAIQVIPEAGKLPIKKWDTQPIGDNHRSPTARYLRDRQQSRRQV